mmetsp:Transcript_9000/g.13435  ORF Transcript_9000/g.13435 Transcript_9000/m.13435 type:complete len:133 (+) Transcript_9000:72-470(+)
MNHNMSACPEENLPKKRIPTEYKDEEAESQDSSTLSNSRTSSLCEGSRPMNRSLPKKKPKVPPPTKAPLEGPILVYRSKGPASTLQVPHPSYLPSQTVSLPKPLLTCECGQKARYRHPKSLEPFCSVKCFKA